ncbi:MAG: bifunctional riboflavin kinase/FAD synthetase [Lachnospiraceae bacterium]
MEYISNTTKFKIDKNSAISLGKFDGIHRGHDKLIAYLRKKKEQGYATVIFTFDIATKNTMDGTIHESVLTTNLEKQHLFESLGIDYLIECPFIPEITSMEPEDFVRMLVADLNVKFIVAGKDFRFGHNRRGDYKMLRKLAKIYHYEVKIFDKVADLGREISSTYIREEIAAGNLTHSNQLLGYPYFIEGTVIYGKQIGRTLDIPTLNMIPGEGKLLLPFGVYVTRTIYNGTCYEGITNIGQKPTIEGIHPIGIETHLFDFNEMIYGAFIKVEFLHKIREEVKFSSLEELKKQMAVDIAEAKKYYTNVTKIC